MTHRPWSEIGIEISSGWGFDDKGDFAEIIKGMQTDKKTMCLLSAILNALREMREEVSTTERDRRRMDNHVNYMQCHWDRDRKLVEDIEKNIQRILNLCEGNRLVLASRTLHPLADIEAFEWFYSVGNSSRYERLIDTAKKALKTMKSCRTFQDVANLPGIGPTRFAKLKAKLKASLNSGDSHDTGTTTAEHHDPIGTAERTGDSPA